MPGGKMADQVIGGVDRKSLQALRQQLAEERKTTRALQRQLASEVELARRAAAETVKARAEREQYRRVLAAAVANEKQALARAEEAAEAVERLEEELRQAILERGTAGGRADELELRMQELYESHRRDMNEIQDRSWSETEEHKRELQTLVYDKGRAVGQARELLARVTHAVPASSRILRARARVCLAAAAACLILALAFLPDLLVGLISPEASHLLAQAEELGFWQLLLVELVLVGLGIALGSWGIRDLRRSERAALMKTVDETSARPGLPRGLGPRSTRLAAVVPEQTGLQEAGPQGIGSEEDDDGEAQESDSGEDEASASTADAARL